MFFKVIISQEISPFHGEKIVWSCRLPEFKWKYLDEYLYNVLDELGEKISNLEKKGNKGEKGLKND